MSDHPSPHPLAPSSPHHQQPVTLLIPVYNRARALAATFGSDVQSKQVAKIVLVDDGSDDDTPQVMQQLQASSPIPVQIVRHATRQGQQCSRMSAIAQAQTEWVMFGEDDVYLGPHYIDTLLAEAQQYAADVIAGRLVDVRVPDAFSPELLRDPTPMSPTAADSIFDMPRFGANYAARSSQPVPAPYVHTIALIRRSLFDQVHFDPFYGGNAVREETDFYLSAAAGGYKIYFSPSVVAYHLRGPIAGSGGQRIPRWKMEYWNFVNTHHLVAKHWPHLQQRYGFRGTPALWMLRFLRGRYGYVFRKVRMKKDE